MYGGGALVHVLSIVVYIQSTQGTIYFVHDIVGISRCLCFKKVSKTHPKCARRPVSLPRTVHQSRKLRELRAKHLTPEQNKNKACVMRMRVRFEESYGKRVWKIAIVASETAGRADEGLCSH